MLNIDNLVNQILVKNASKYPEFVINTLKSYNLEAIYTSFKTYEISNTYKWYYQVEEAIQNIKNFLLKCPELHVKNISTRISSGIFMDNKYTAIITFEV